MLAEKAVDKIYIWPLKVRLLGKTGYTLWTQLSDENETDVLLAIGENILLFKTFKSMTDFVASGSASNIAATKGYRNLFELIIKGRDSQELFAPDNNYDFNRTGEILKAGHWERWTINNSAKVLNALNLLWDMAKTLDDLEIIDSMKRGTPLREFMNTLSFITRKDLADLAKLDAQYLSSIYYQNLARIERRILQVC